MPRYRQLLARTYYEERGKAPGGSAKTDAIDVISGEALFGGDRHKLSNRVAWHEDAIWIDLSDDRWRAVRVSADGWEIVDNPPICFRDPSPIPKQRSSPAPPTC
jgi:hypothetical protein